MQRKTPMLYSSTPLENNDLEQRIEKRLSDASSSSNSIKNNKEMIVYYGEKIINPKRLIKNKILNTIKKSFDTFVIIATTSSSIILSFTGSGLIVIPISSGTACGLTNRNKVI